MPRAGMSVGGRCVRTGAPENATAIGSGDSLATSTTIMPPRSATAQTRWTASPSGTRTRVSTTGVPSIRRCRTVASEAGTCHRSSAAMCHDNVEPGRAAAPHGVTSPHGATDALTGSPVTPTVIGGGDSAPAATVAVDRSRAGIAPPYRREAPRPQTTPGARPPDGRVLAARPYIVPVDVAVLVPVKRFTAAKGRLATVLGDDVRAGLAEWMAARVLDAVAELPTFVACDDPDVRDWAERRGATVLWGPGLGLNGAVDDGVRRIRERGHRHVVVAHADLPRPGPLRELAVPGRTVLVPDRRRDGTNVMAFPTAAPLRAEYGAGSFSRHLAQAMADDAHVVELRRDRDLSLDIDTPLDLRHPLIEEVLPSWLRTTRDNPRSG